MLMNMKNELEKSPKEQLVGTAKHKPEQKLLALRRLPLSEKNGRDGKRKNYANTNTNFYTRLVGRNF